MIGRRTRKKRPSLSKELMEKAQQEEQIRTRIILRVYDAGADVIRETLNLATGHIHMESMGWCDIRRAYIPEETRQRLSAEEVAYVQMQLEFLRENQEMRDRSDAFMLHADINRVRMWIEQASLSDVRKISDQLMYEMQELRKALMEKLSLIEK